MKKLIYILIVLFFLPLINKAQTTDVLNKVAEQAAENTIKELISLPKDTTKRVISVVPFISSNDQTTTNSKEFTKKYIELLNKKIAATGLNYTIIGDEFNDPQFSDLVFNTDLNSQHDQDFWDNYLKIFKPKYIIKGNYKIDNQGNRLYFENIAIYNNWLEENFVNKISIADASAEISNKYVLHSLLLPGLGQVKRGQNSAGYTIMALSGLTITSTILMESMRQIMLSKSRSNPYSIVYKDNANLFGTLRTVSLIGFGATYIFNVVHSVTYKPKNLFLTFNLYPELNSQYFMCSLTFKL